MDARMLNLKRGGKGHIMCISYKATGNDARSKYYNTLNQVKSVF